MDPMDRNTDLINEIGNGLVNDPWLTEEAPDWEAVSLSVRVAPGVVRMSGYTYADDGEGPRAGNPRSQKFYGLFRELQETMAQVSPKPWVACLVQIDRTSGKVHYEFEHDDPMRWQVTPTNVGTLPQEMRPTQEV